MDEMLGMAGVEEGHAVHVGGTISS
jgi:hypothetical protein